MPNTKTSARVQVGKLVQFFEQNFYQFKAQNFNETQARQQLIDPFFEALGWDVHNREMRPLHLQEVVPEGRVKTKMGMEVKEQPVLFESKETLGKQYKEYASILDYIAEDEYKASAKEATKKPDYRFRIKGQTKFFVEAKKPKVDLANDQMAIFQVKRYGFSGRVPVSILTDFEEFRVFDCTHKPLFEKPKLGVIKEFDLGYKQYLDGFDLLFETFSRDAVEGGSLEALTKKLLQKRTGDFPLDKFFLDDLSKWRGELARDIAKHPQNRRRLNDYTLNESVQRILDRIVFFRVCEDREIEVEHTLLAILRMWKDRPGVSLYSLLNNLFRQRRELYNGLLFSPHECEELEVSDKVLIDILENLNYPFSPYHFNEIGVEILGSIYEKFLGKTIHLTKKTVRIEEKDEVRKAGGVYYTPQYIVDYIVENTLGKLLYSNADGSKENQKRILKLSPKQVAKLKIIDIACGSGSFLLGAFQKLINYHIDWYTQHPDDIQTLNNVSDAYKDFNGNFLLSPRKKRDILLNNIYGVDIDRQAVEVTQMSLYLKVLEGENSETLNPQMTLALKEVYLPSLVDNIKCGNSLIGTDIDIQGELFDSDIQHKVNPFDWGTEFKEIMENGGFDCVIGNPPWVFGGGVDIEQFEKSYFQRTFESAKGKVNLFALFIERATKLIKSNGVVSYIVPNTLLRVTSYHHLRQYLLSNYWIKEIVDLGTGIFHKVTMSTIIITLEKFKGQKNPVIIKKGLSFALSQIHQEIFIKNNFILNIFASKSDNKISEKLNSESVLLGDLCKELIFGVVITKNFNKVVFEKKTKGLKPFVEGRDIGRYYTPTKTRYLLYKRELLHRPRTPNVFEASEKIMIQRITGGNRPLNATYDDNQLYNKESINNIILKEGVQYSSKYILGLINSTLLNWFYQITFTNASKLTVNLSKEYLSQLPIHSIDFSKTTEKKRHDELVSLVKRMLELNKELNKANFDSEKEPVQRQISATDKKIDRLVYELYGLTEEEIKIVEGE